MAPTQDGCLPSEKKPSGHTGVAWEDAGSRGCAHVRRGSPEPACRRRAGLFLLPELWEKQPLLSGPSFQRPWLTPAAPPGSSQLYRGGQDSLAQRPSALAMLVLPSGPGPAPAPGRPGWWMGPPSRCLAQGPAAGWLGSASEEQVCAASADSGAVSVPPGLAFSERWAISETQGALPTPLELKRKKWPPLWPWAVAAQSCAAGAAPETWLEFSL